MKINNIKYIFFVIAVAQSLFSMDFNEKPVSCTTIANAVNIVPGVVAPLGVGCVGENGIVVLEENAFTVWDAKKQCAVIQRRDAENKEKMHDFAINHAKTKVALSRAGGLIVYDVCTAQPDWQYDRNYRDFLPIALDSANRIISYCKKQGKTQVFFKNSYRYKDWPNVSLESNELFAHHPSKKKIIFGVTDRQYFLGHYERGFYSGHDLSFPDACFFSIGQLYDSDGSGAAIIGRSGQETYIHFIGICASNVKAWTREAIGLPKLCVAMTFHPNNKLFFLLDKNNTIDCFDYKTKECIHTIHCKNQETISPHHCLEKRLAVLPSGKALFAALKDKVVKIKLPFKIFFSSEEKEQLFFMWSALQLHEDASLPFDVIHLIMNDAFKLCRKDAIKNTK